MTQSQRLTLGLALFLSLSAIAPERSRGQPAVTGEPTSRPTTAVAQEAHERHVRHLAAGTPRDQVNAAQAALVAAGVDAFPTLLAHLYDDSPADEGFRGDRLAPGPVQPPVEMSETCFYLLQSQVEGEWPKMYREFYVLTPANAAWWLATHRGMSLAQLRHAANAQSLAQAQSALAACPTSAYLKKNVAFLERLQHETAEPKP